MQMKIETPKNNTIVVIIIIIFLLTLRLLRNCDFNICYFQKNFAQLIQSKSSVFYSKNEKFSNCTDTQKQQLNVKLIQRIKFIEYIFI